MRRLIYTALLAIMLAACDRTTTENDGGGAATEPTGQGTGQRPGTGEPTDVDVILADGVPRFVSPERSMRADAPGVLVKRDAEDTYWFINLDTRDKVEIRLAAELADLVVVECGKEYRPDVVTLVADDGTTRRILAEIRGENPRLMAIVIPYF